MRCVCVFLVFFLSLFSLTRPQFTQLSHFPILPISHPGIYSFLFSSQLWAHRVDCWWSALPAASQSTLRSCAGALGLHLSGRLDAALGRTPKPTMAQPGCEWIRQGAPQLEMLPEMPPADGIHFRLPPLPRMLPGWLQLEAQSREGGARTEPMERAAASPAERHAPKSAFYATFGIGAASGALGALALSAAIWLSGGRRRS